MEKDTQVLVSQPLDLPVALMEALCRLFDTRPDVEAAYIAQISYPGEAPHPIVGVRTEGSWDALGAEIGRLIDRTQIRLTVDAVPLADDGLSDALRAYPPFYQREGVHP
jgi:SseB protein C-terminal domain